MASSNAIRKKALRAGGALKMAGGGDVWKLIQRSIRRGYWKPDPERHTGSLEGRLPADVADEYQRILEQEFAKLKPAIRVPEDALTGIFRSGQFKNQFQTGNSRGAYDPEMRSEAEQWLFGYPLNTPGIERPKYGYFGRPDDPTQSHGDWNIGQYGDIVSLLKPSTKKRATFTMGDSLSWTNSDQAAPALASKPKLHASGRDYVYEQLYGNDVGGHNLLDYLTNGYIEAQYHGPLTLKDVEGMLVPRQSPWDLQRRISDHGIPVDRYAGGGLAHAAGGGLQRVLDVLKRGAQSSRNPEAFKRFDTMANRVPERLVEQYEPIDVANVLNHPLERFGVINPKDFERMAGPINSVKAVHVNGGNPLPWDELPSGSRLAIMDLQKLVREGVPFDQVPFLGVNARNSIDGYSSIAWHEGRHRNRALHGESWDKSLIRLQPGPEGYADQLPRENYLQYMKPGYNIEPELYRKGYGGPDRIPYEELFQGEPFAQGGAVFDPRVRPRQFFGKGGAIRNWLRDVPGSYFETALRRLRGHVNATDDVEQALRNGADGGGDALDRYLAHPDTVRDKALSKWVDTNLANYIVRQHGLENDPLKPIMGENYVSAARHKPAAEWYEDAGLLDQRGTTSQPEWPTDPHETPFGQLYPKWFKDVVEQDWPRHWSQKQYDMAINAKRVNGRQTTPDAIAAAKERAEMQGPDPAEKYQRRFQPPMMLHDLSTPWGETYEPELRNTLDYLRTQDPNIIPRINVPDAIRKSRAWHAEMEKKAANAENAVVSALPVYKSYPGGWTWREMSRPSDKELGVRMDADPSFDPEAARSQVYTAAMAVGKQLGHCYQNPSTCHDYLGRSKLYTLIDSKGKAHGTIEVTPDGKRGDAELRRMYETYQGQREDAQLERRAGEIGEREPTDTNTDDEGDAYHGRRQSGPGRQHPTVSLEDFRALYGNRDAEQLYRIDTMHGPQYDPYNSHFRDEAIPYVQDFVTSGDWTNVADLKYARMTRDPDTGAIVPFEDRAKGGLVQAEPKNSLRPPTSSGQMLDSAQANDADFIEKLLQAAEDNGDDEAYDEAVRYISELLGQRETDVRLQHGRAP